MLCIVLMIVACVWGMPQPQEKSTNWSIKKSTSLSCVNDVCEVKTCVNDVCTSSRNVEPDGNKDIFDSDNFGSNFNINHNGEDEIINRVDKNENVSGGSEIISNRNITNKNVDIDNGVEWIDIDNLQDNEGFVPQNIENNVGFFGGMSRSNRRRCYNGVCEERRCVNGKCTTHRIGNSDITTDILTL